MTKHIVDANGPLSSHAASTSIASEILAQTLKRDLCVYPTEVVLDALVTVWINLAFACGKHATVRRAATDISRNFPSYVSAFNAAQAAPKGHA